MSPDEDMIVIGGGAAGLTAAGMAASLGARTLLVEADRLGGECTWTGCVPSKTLLAAARSAHEMRTARRHGVEAIEPRIDFARVMRHVRLVRQEIYQQADAPETIEAYWVRVVQARAKFLDTNTVELSHADSSVTRSSARYFVIATGSRARTPEGSIPFLTNDNLFELEKQPRRLLVLGAGPVGIEMAQAFRRLGSDVTVVAPDARILGKDDPELTAILLQSLTSEGVRSRRGRIAREFIETSGGVQVRLDDGSRIECDRVLAAIGRAPRVDGLCLDKAGVRYEAGGIVVDDCCRTSQRHVFAAGDVTTRPRFTHYAEHMSRVAVSNAILKLPLKLDSRHLVWSTYTDRELAHVGATEAQLRERHVRAQVHRFPYAELDRAVTEQYTTGLIKVHATPCGRILGASILGAHAGELIAGYALAMKNGLKLRHISETIHPYPTYMMGNRRAADLWYLGKRNPRVLRWIQRLFGYRGEIRDLPG